MNLTLSKKQYQLKNDIVSKNVPEIYVLGSAQSGKTFDICLSLLEYARNLYNYDKDKQYNGCIVGWTIDTLKSNIVENFLQIFNKFGWTNKKEYEMSWSSSEEKYLKIYNLKIFFFGFNNVTSFNKILGKPLILVWVDESARIYTQRQLQPSFDELPGRQVSFADHPYLKTIHSFNVEGSSRHPYKIKYIDGKPEAKHYTFFPYDNPLLNTEEAIKKVVNIFADDTLRKQKIFNQWIVAEGRVFPNIPVIDNIDNYVIREIGIGIDYGSVNPTTFVPIALAYDKVQMCWELLRLEIYYHDPSREGDNPTTEFYSKQLVHFIRYLGHKYNNVPITDVVIDSEASHFDNRLIADGIHHSLSKKGPGSVSEGVEHLQSLFYKEFLHVFECDSIRYFNEDETPVYSGKDEGLIELESYQYDKIKSEITGTNVYKKELDHSIDAIRYIIRVFVDTGRCPQI